MLFPSLAGLFLNSSKQSLCLLFTNSDILKRIYIFFRRIDNEHLALLRILFIMAIKHLRLPARLNQALPKKRMTEPKEISTPASISWVLIQITGLVGLITQSPMV